jgi:hypothetical protein
MLTMGWHPFASRLLEMVTEEVGALPTVDSVFVVWDPTWDAGADERVGREKLGLLLERLEQLREARLRGEGSLSRTTCWSSTAVPTRSHLRRLERARNPAGTLPFEVLQATVCHTLVP